MKFAAQVLQLLIEIGFGFAKVNILKGDAKKYLDIGLEAIDTARKAFALVDIFQGDELTPEERKASQQAFDEAQERFRDKYRRD